jgi:hypothetical protein
MGPNRRSSINSHIYSQLIPENGAQNSRGKKDNLLNKCCWENQIATCRRLTLDPCLSPVPKINSKWIKDPTMRPETLKQLQEAVGNTLEQIGTGNDFPKRTQKAQHLREAMNKQGLHQTKELLHSKGNSHQTQETAEQNGRKSLPATHLIKDSTRTYRDLKKLSPQRTNTPLKKWAHELNGILKGRGTNGQ